MSKAKSGSGNQNPPITPFPPIEREETLFVSRETSKKILDAGTPEHPGQDVVWTTSITHELPIVVKKKGPGSFTPKTIPEVMHETCIENAKLNSLAYKVKGKWTFWTYEQFYRDCKYFSNGLISLGIESFKTLSVIGFNHPAWFLAFYGSWAAGVIPLGVYTTNGAEACKYIADHASTEVALVENKEHLTKYLKVWDQLPNLKYIIIYNDKVPEDLPQDKKGKVMTFQAFLELGKKHFETTKDKDRLERLKNQRPGHCCTIVYTSGTTGNPKGVMLSHDNYTWLSAAYVDAYYEMTEAYPPGSSRIVSYLPLSHVAGQFAELFIPFFRGSCIYFAEPTALQGTLIETLKEVKPTHFTSVPRLYEKIEDTMKRIGKSKGFPLKNIADWAKSIGIEGTFAEMNNTDKPFMWDLAKTLVYKNVKKALGLDECSHFTYGAAPLSVESRKYFASLNMYLSNVFGMSENGGPATFYSPFKGVPPSLESAGLAIPGSEIKIFEPDSEGKGEICIRGRHRFMGYLNDVNATKNTIDINGYLHSGDQGRIDKWGHLFITGRIKELLITAGGENVAPLIIEQEVKLAIPELAQCVVIGDAKKYLTCLLTLKHVTKNVGYPEPELDPLVISDLKSKGIEGSTPAELRKNPKFVAYIEEGLKKANSKAISNAQTVKKWILLDRDFSIANDEITPTLKLKRLKIYKSYHDIIETMYPPDPKL